MNRCEQEVTKIVSLPYLEGDVYCVCDRHESWAKVRVGVRARVRPNDHREIASGCVFTDEIPWRHPSVVARQRRGAAGIVRVAVSEEPHTP